MKQILSVMCMLWVATTSLPACATELSEQRCRELMDELQPGKDALWRTIPWKLSVVDARETAWEENKPIFIWAMDGHPLGCT